MGWTLAGLNAMIKYGQHGARGEAIPVMTAGEPVHGGATHSPRGYVPSGRGELPQC